MRNAENFEKRYICEKYNMKALHVSMLPAIFPICGSLEFLY